MVKNEVTEYLSNFKTDRNDYFFILDYKNRKIFQKINDTSNKSFRDLNSEEEVDLFNELTNSVKNDKNIVTYSYKLDNLPLVKTSYLKDLPNWEWIIGRGFYHDCVNQSIQNKTEELDDKFQKRTIDILFITSISTILLLIISSYLLNFRT